MILKNASLILALALLISLSLLLGGSGYGANELWAFLSQTATPEINSVFTSFRIPRTLTCIFVGAALAMASLLLQNILDNPLAEPYTLGLSGGATLGALGVLILGLQPQSLTLPIGGIVGCFFSAAIILAAIKRFKKFAATSLILIGIMISLFCGSLVTLMLSLFEPHKLSTAINWMMGFVGTPRDLWWPATASVVCVALLWMLFRAKQIDSYLLGEDIALSLHGNKSLRTEVIVIVTLLTAFSVAQAGLLGFVGLISPHLAQQFIGSRRLEKSLLAVPVTGASLLLLADSIGRAIGGDREIPAGGLVALLGAPFLCYLIFKRSKHARV